MGGSSNRYNDLLNQVPRLQVRNKVLPLSGGLTNINLKVETEQGDYVARISSNKSELLAIDRKAEYENSKIAAKVGIGAPVYDFLPEFGLLVIGFIEGKTYESDDVVRNLPRIAHSCRQLHAAPPFVRDFDMFVIQQNYLKIVTQSNFKLPPNYLEYANHIEQIKRAVAILDEGKVACNNDLLPANFIDDGEKIHLIDYEYSGNNDACFELGNIWSEADLPKDALTELVTAYYGRWRPEKVARAWLFALLAKYGWSLWASIQSAISELDFDFWQWGMHRYQYAVDAFESKQFNEALVSVTKPS
jgi:thiamine kinase-like enzyme